MVISVVIGTLGTIFKVLVTELEDWEIIGKLDTIQIAELLGSARILRRALVT